MPFKQFLANKLNISPNRFRNHNLKYYYTKQPELCCRFNLSPIDSNVQPYDFQHALSILQTYFKDIHSSYYLNLFNESKKYNHNILDATPDHTLDHLVLEYLKFRPNTYVITLWPLALDSDSSDKFAQLRNLLNQHGHIYYIRKFNLSFNAAANLVYQLYSDVKRLSSIDKIYEKLDYIGWKKNQVASFKIVLFDHTSNHRISGSRAPLKEDIRHIWLADHPKHRGDDFVHINDHFYQTIDYCRLYLHRPSLVALHHQNLSVHLHDNMVNCRIYINTIKQWITKNLHPIDFDRFLLLGSTTLYIYGIRTCRDIDGLVSQHPVAAKSSDFHSKIINSFNNRNSKFFFADIGMKGSSAWKNSWDIKDKPWFDLIGIQYRDELIFNPDNYFYYNGIKFISLINNARRRCLRKRFSDYVDLLQINKYTNLDIILPNISKRYSKEEFIKLVTEYLNQRYPNDKHEFLKILSNLNVDT